MSRGFVGILAALALSSLATQFVHLQAGAQTGLLHARANALFLERAYFGELAFKDSLRSVLSHANGNGRREFAQNAAEKLEAWQAQIEGFYARQGAIAKAWWGFASAAEIDGMKNRTLLQGTPVACSCCFSFNEYYESEGGGGELEKRHYAEAAIDYDFELREIRLSKNRADGLPQPLCDDGNAPDANAPLVFGVSIYYPEGPLAAVFLARDGFSAKTWDGK
ncbi:MAG: hypothetical protein WC792_05490 [Candidatus Micrarchaeia archaeon]|jgi:hypothetical protein